LAHAETVAFRSGDVRGRRLLPAPVADVGCRYDVQSERLGVRSSHGGINLDQPLWTGLCIVTAPVLSWLWIIDGEEVMVTDVGSSRGRSRSSQSEVAHS